MSLVTKEKMASLLDYDPTLPQYWSEHPRDKVFGANCNAFSSKLTGFSICHPIYHENTMYLATRHAIDSAALSTEATATFMFLPSWNKRMTANLYASLYRAYANSWAPHHQTNSNMQKYPSGTIYRRPFPNTLGRCTSLPCRNCLNACNKNWLKELAKKLPEAKWEINCIHNEPYRT
jgi:hypothetical protein